jgi:histidine decarboxylase
MPSIVIRTNQKGEMDYDDLKDTVQLNRHRPAIILANIGTTMTEARDDIPQIKTILRSCALKSYYIHCDAALAGVYLPLIQEQVTFTFPSGADSIAVSGHKFIGAPIPCGVVVVKKSYKNRIGRSIPYIGNLDTTIPGSRNAITRLFLWYGLQQLGKNGLKERAHSCLQLADWLQQQLMAIGIKAWRNDKALTVVFPQPSQRICNKWQLASEVGISHVICMPGITQQQLQLFLNDMQEWVNCPGASQIETEPYHLN